MTVDINNCQDSIEIDPEIEEFMENCILTGLKAEGISIPVEVSILLVDDNHIRELNKTYRGIDAPTDVLSFPMLEFESDDGKREITDVMNDAEKDGDTVILGDIVISVERALNQAREYNHSFLREMGFLLIHGLLHLLGYDHMDEGERLEMRQKEESILKMLNLTRDGQ